jgi:hypothetical protein
MKVANPREAGNWQFMDPACCSMPSHDSNLKTKDLTIAANLQSIVFNVLKFGSPETVVSNHLSAEKGAEDA